MYFIPLSDTSRESIKDQCLGHIEAASLPPATKAALSSDCVGFGLVDTGGA